LSCFFSAAAAENFAALLAAIWIVWPVAGLRPSRAVRSLTLNLPKPAIATSRPAASRWRSLRTLGVDGALGVLAGDAGSRGDLLCELVLGHRVLLGSCASTSR
jgi:hypothetical protein